MAWELLETQIERAAEMIIMNNKWPPETVLDVLRGLNARCKDGERRLEGIEKRLRDLEVRHG